MIHVPKPRSLIPDEFMTEAERENKKVKAHFENPATSDSAYEYTAYKCKALKKRLDEIFNWKCAYCEFPYEGGFSAHGDHWRPKGSVKENGTRFRPGYYWLAAEWDNLFPTCQYCNTWNEHEFEDRKAQTAGKLDQFPLAQPRTAGAKIGDEHVEIPLLLNPSVDRPAEHLTYLKEGERQGVIAPRLDAHGEPSAKGLASIRVYALDRMTLVKVRRDRLITLKERLYDLETFAKRVKRDPSDEEYRHDLTRAIEVFKQEYLARKRPFLGMVYEFTLPLLHRMLKYEVLRPYLEPLREVLPEGALDI